MASNPHRVLYAFLFAVFLSSFSWQVRGANRTVYSFIEYLTHPPKITLHPQSQAVRNGAWVVFQCDADGNPKPEIKWRKNGKYLSGSQARVTVGWPRSGGILLRLDPVRGGKDDTVYECVAENGAGYIVSDPASLKIYEENKLPDGFPIISSMAASKDVDVGSSAILECPAKGYPEPEIQWFKDSMPIESYDDNISLMKFGALKILNSTEADQGKYECRAENYIGTDYSKTLELHVKGKVAPQFLTTPPPVQKMKFNGNLTLSCEAIGTPTPSLFWIKGSGENLLITQNDSLTPSSLGQSLLQLKNMEESYNYSCVATNPLGTVRASTYVKVQPVLVPPENVSSSEVTANSFTLSWTYQYPPDSVHFLILYRSHSTKDLTLTSEGIVGLEATITQLTPSTKYEVCVLAVNSVRRGPCSTVANITTSSDSGRPSEAATKLESKLNNVHIRPLSSSTIVIQWDEPDLSSGFVQGYYIYHTMDLQSLISQWETQFCDSNSLTTISGLKQHSTYAVRIQALTSIGTLPISNAVHVKTQQGAPSQPNNVRAIFINTTVISLKWNKPVYASENIHNYEVFWVDSYQNKKFSKELPVTENYNLTDLYPNTDYRIWLVASSLRGEGASSPSLYIRTQDYTPSACTIIKLEAVNASSIYIKWKLVTDSKFIVGFRILVFERDKGMSLTSDLISVNIENKTAEETIVCGLQPSVNYSVIISSYLYNKNGVYSQPVNISTFSEVPSKISFNISVNGSSSELGVKLEWKPAENNVSGIIGYKIKYGIRGSQLTETLSLSHQFVLTPVLWGCEYEFHLSASNSFGFGEEEVKYLMTPEEIPYGPPENLTYLFQTQDVVSFQWEPPLKTLQNGLIIRYEAHLEKKMDPSSVISRNSSETKVVFSGLEDSSVYIIKVRAVNRVGPGPWCTPLLTPTPTDVFRAPIEVKAVATTVNSIFVWWQNVPYKGKILGYRIFYTSAAVEDLDKWRYKTVPISDSALLTNLEINTDYAIAVATLTIIGLGKLSDKISTKVKVEQVPVNIQANEIRTHSMTLSWLPPLRFNPINYSISYGAVKEFVDSQGITQIQSISKKLIVLDNDQLSCSITELSPFTTYTVNISVVPVDHHFIPPVTIMVTTQMAAPQPMVKPDFYGVVNSEEIQVILPQASEEYGPISHYYLFVVPESNWSTVLPPDQYQINKILSDLNETRIEDLDCMPYIAAKFSERNIPYTFHLGNNETYEGFTNKKLKRGIKYRIFVRAIVDTLQKHLYTSSPFSESLALDMREVPPGEPPRRLDPGTFGDNTDVSIHRNENENSVTWTLIPIFTALSFSFCFILISLSKRKQASSKYPDVTIQIRKGSLGNDQESCKTSLDPVEAMRLLHQTPAMIAHPPVQVAYLSQHIEALKMNDNAGFSQEYESIEPGQQFTWDCSSMQVNKSKNRYANVIAYDHSRVVLKSAPNDYINANYCHGYKKQHAFVATQGPLVETFVDFWFMIWELRSPIIVMMTRLEERGRIKCDQYWPLKESQSYPPFTVSLYDSEEFATHTTRTLVVSKEGETDCHYVKHCQFTGWPDHGVPDHPGQFLQFVHKVHNLASVSTNSGPTTVHCSAGVGRTGCYIVIDSMLERIKCEETIDIYGHVTCLRSQRNYMVQTEEQYIFIYEAVLEAVICWKTQVPCQIFNSHFSDLINSSNSSNTSKLQNEFQKLSKQVCTSNHFVAANLPCNQAKNRFLHILPIERTRVCLSSLKGVEGSDYINASHIDGYRKCNAYIAAQGPLAVTVEDFWRMLWEHNSNIVVMLTKLNELGKDKCHQYWPSERSIRYSYYTVEPIAEYNMPSYILREFKISQILNGSSHTLRQFQFTEWPEQGVPTSTNGFIDFIGQVHKTKDQFGHDGPITVHCSGGVGRTGVFIVLSIVLEQMRCEGIIDIFQTVRILRTQRPAMVQTEDQYQFCYQTALEYLNTFNNYVS